MIRKPLDALWIVLLLLILVASVDHLIGYVHEHCTASASNNPR